MVLDHIHQMFYMRYDLTILNMLGRPVLPIFIYMCSEGFYYTKDRKKNATRLFIASTLMSIVTWIIEINFSIEGVILMNNVFMTMLMSVLMMMAFDYIRNKDFKMAFMLILLPLIVSYLIISFPEDGNLTLFRLLTYLPNFIMVEGSMLVVLLAVYHYAFRNNRLYWDCSRFINHNWL